jgi:hypothetical protein
VIEKLEKFVNNLNKTKTYLILANIFLVFFLILLNNFKIIPLRTGDFIFFTILTLAFALYRPGWAFLFFIGTATLENINLAPVDLGISVRPYQLLGALILLAVAVRFFSKKLYFKLPSLKWYDYTLLVVVFSGFLSVINAPEKITSFKLAIIFATFFALYYLVRVYIQNSEDLKRIIPFLISSGIVVVLYGIWQNWRFMRNLSNFEIMPGRPNASFAEADWLGMFLVLFISVVYVLIYNYFVIAMERSDRGNLVLSKDISTATGLLRFARNDMILYILLVLSYILLILTVSRSAWLGAFFTTFIFLWAVLTDFKFKNWQWKKTIKIKLGIICSLLVSLAIVYIFHLTNFQLSNRIQSTGTGLQKITVSCYITDCDCINQGLLKQNSVIKNIDELKSYGCTHINLEDIESEKSQGRNILEIYRQDPNVQTRSEIYKKSWEQIKNHPLFGIGWGSISSVLGKDERGAGLNSSNIFLEIWLGSGIIGFLAFVMFWCYIIFNSIKNFYFSSDALQKTICLFILISWFGLTIANLFNAGILLGFLWIWFGATQIFESTLE